MEKPLQIGTGLAADGSDLRAVEENLPVTQADQLPATDGCRADFATADAARNPRGDLIRRQKPFQLERSTVVDHQRSSLLHTHRCGNRSTEVDCKKSVKYQQIRILGIVARICKINACVISWGSWFDAVTPKIGIGSFIEAGLPAIAMKGLSKIVGIAKPASSSRVPAGVLCMID
ncbi:hypothetical protein GC170_06605 [bacterium]|nr:hypothetical protein [bacterium]